MNYQKHYNLLIERARNRSLSIYTESHHIIPRCMGGGDEDNLVDLTPEEHYVAHQLLVKIYPENSSLIRAAHMMTVSGHKTIRNNKKFGWLRRKMAKIISIHNTGKNLGNKFAVGSWKADNRRMSKHKTRMSGNTYNNGRKQSSETKQKRNRSLSNLIWITNGIDNGRIPNKLVIPDGWYAGRTYRRKEISLA